QVQQLPAAGDQGLQFTLVLGPFLQQARRELGGIALDDLRVDRIGLGQDAQRQCEVAHLLGIGQVHLQAGLQQRIEQGTLQSAGGLDDNQLGRRFEKKFHQLSDSSRIVGEADDLLDAALRQVKLVLGDVDAGEGAI